MISWWLGCLLGALGGAVADGTKLAGVMITKKAWPWNTPKQRAPLFVALVIRVACAAAVSAVLADQQIVGWSDRPLALFLAGAAAPSVVQQGTRIVRVAIKAIMHDYLGGGGGQ
jgi:hypothetical protein